MAVATGIAPNELMDTDIEVFRLMVDRLNEEAQRAQRSHQG